MVRKDVIAEESADEITDALLNASRVLVAVSARSIAEVDDTITIPQFRTLVILSTQGSSNIAGLAAQLNVQPSTAGRMVERLIAAGLVDRKVNPESRRELIVELTRMGSHIVDAVTTRRRRELAAVVHKMAPEHRAGMVEVLTAFSAAGGAEPHVATQIHSHQF